MNLKSMLIVAALVVGGTVIAQGGAKAGQGGPQGGAGQRGQGGPGGPGGPAGQFRTRTPEERVERLSSQLKLNADQKKKILAIYKAQAPKQKALMDDKKMTREQKMEAFGKMREEGTKKIKAVLTKDQIKKYDEMRSQQRRGGPGGAPGGRPGGAPPAGGKGGGRG